jgi:6-phosphogluconolactonase
VRLIVGADARAAARLAAEEVARAIRDACANRGRALLAFSGGETPWLMLADLRERDLDWSRVHVAQVDERVAPAGDPRRNLERLEALMTHEGPLPAGNLHAMSVEAADLDTAAARYQAALEAQFGAPLRFDLVQLGLGADGHTASLVPGDAVLQVTDRDVATTSGDYQGLRRMTLTYPAIDRARERMWLVTGASKVGPLVGLLEGIGDAPAVKVTRQDSVVVADEEAWPSPGLRPTSPSSGRG